MTAIVRTSSRSPDRNTIRDGVVLISKTRMVLNRERKNFVRRVNNGKATIKNSFREKKLDMHQIHTHTIKDFEIFEGGEI